MFIRIYEYTRFLFEFINVPGFYSNLLMYQVFIRIYKYTIYIITEILLVSETMSDQLRYTLAHNGSDLLQYGMTITRF